MGACCTVVCGDTSTGRAGLRLIGPEQMFSVRADFYASYQ